MIVIGLSQNIGTVVMYAHALGEVARRAGTSEINLQNFAESFALGFPSEEQLSKIWQAQKGDSCDPPVSIDNCLDASSPTGVANV